MYICIYIYVCKHELITPGRPANEPTVCSVVAPYTFKLPLLAEKRMLNSRRVMRIRAASPRWSKRDMRINKYLVRIIIRPDRAQRDSLWLNEYIYMRTQNDASARCLSVCLFGECWLQPGELWVVDILLMRRNSKWRCLSSQPLILKVNTNNCVNMPSWKRVAACQPTECVYVICALAQTLLYMYSAYIYQQDTQDPSSSKPHFWLRVGSK